MELTLNDLRGDYTKLVDYVINNGAPVETRGFPTTELTAVTLIFPNLLNPLLPLGVGRGINPRLAALEALQLISGIQRQDLIDVATPGFKRILVDDENPDYGAYGPRIVEQLGECAFTLKSDPTTRQAVIAIWNERDLTHRGDKPCTVFLQFLVRSQLYGYAALELHVHMRSQDVWLGVPYDVFMFTQLQHTMAKLLGLPVGRYVHHTTSLHIYERDLEAASKLTMPTTSEPELPLGVVAPEALDLLTPLDVAGYVLEDSAEDEELAVNPWYAKQLRAVHDAVKCSATPVFQS